MKNNKLYLTILSFVSMLTLSAQIDSVYYYNPDSTKEMFYVQKDMYNFRLANGAEFNLSSSNAIVDEIQHLLKTPRKLNLIKFTNGVTEADIQNFISTNLNIPEFEFAAKVMSKDINSLTDYSQEKFLTTDDLLLVTFKDPLISQADIDAFMNRHDLILEQAPLAGLSSAASWSYEFRLIYNLENYDRNTIDVCKKIFEEENDIVKISVPSITYLDDADNFSTIAEIDYYNNITPNEMQWQIANRENTIFDKFTALTLFPNPFSDVLKIQIPSLSEKDNYSLALYNQLGQQVVNQKINTKITVINTSSLSKAMYFYKLINHSTTSAEGKVLKN